MNDPLPEIRIPKHSPGERNSMPPNVNFAMVLYRLAKDMSQNLAVAGGVLIAIVLIIRIPSAVWPAVVAASGPNLLGMLWKSKPSEDH